MLVIDGGVNVTMATKFSQRFRHHVPRGFDARPLSTTIDEGVDPLATAISCGSINNVGSWITKPHWDLVAALILSE